jgi:hypothetical protein
MIGADEVTAGQRAARELLGVAATIPGLRVDPGLTDVELDAVQARFGFTFAADHRAFLASRCRSGRSGPTGAPATGPTCVGGWTGRSRVCCSTSNTTCTGPTRAVRDRTRSRMRWRRRVLGSRRCRSWCRSTPTATCRPAGPWWGIGHPVLSVYQTDVIYYGMDLLDYVRQEFRAGSGIDRTDRRWRPQAFVAFWRDLIE